LRRQDSIMAVPAISNCATPCSIGIPARTHRAAPAKNGRSIRAMTSPTGPPHQYRTPSPAPPQALRLELCTLEFEGGQRPLSNGCSDKLATDGRRKSRRASVRIGPPQSDYTLLSKRALDETRAGGMFRPAGTIRGCRPRRGLKAGRGVPAGRRSGELVKSDWRLPGQKQSGRRWIAGFL